MVLTKDVRPQGQQEADNGAFKQAHWQAFGHILTTKTGGGGSFDTADTHCSDCKRQQTCYLDLLGVLLGVLLLAGVLEVVLLNEVLADFDRDFEADGGGVTLFDAERVADGVLEGLDVAEGGLGDLVTDGVLDDETGGVTLLVGDTGGVVVLVGDGVSDGVFDGVFDAAGVLEDVGDTAGVFEGETGVVVGVGDGRVPLLSHPLPFHW